MKTLSVLILLLTTSICLAQEQTQTDVPYYEVPKYSEDFTAGTVAARMIDGLGFRFYWATAELTQTDLDYRPGENVRSAEETIDHILDLSFIIVNSTLKKSNDTVLKDGMSFNEKRLQALKNLKTAADILRQSDDISQYKIIFGEREFPFWNQINGPIADAIWHCGQLASFRRTSGNPINSNISHFTGTVKQ